MTEEMIERTWKVYQLFTSDKTDPTVRSVAKCLKVSKSTIHKDTKRLKELSYPKWEEVQKILKKNKAERHIRGGIATRMKYKR